MVGVLYALACALSWAAGSVSMKNLSKKLDPSTLNAPRALVGGIALLILAAATGRTSGAQDLSPQALFLMVGSMALGGGVGDSLYVTSMALVGVSRAYPISCTYPAITLVLAALFLDEPITPAVVAGMVLVIGGVMLISRPSGTGSRPTSARAHRTGVVLALLAAACWAGASIILSPATEGVDPILVSAVRLPALALIFWGLVGLRGTAGTLRTLSRKEWLTITLGGLVGMGVGSLLFVVALSHLGPTRTAILTSTSPLFAIPMTVLFMNERPSRAVLVGTAVTVAGVALVS